MTKYSKQFKDADTPFNMAMLFYITLNKLLERKNFAYICMDYQTWYRSLVAIYRTIYFKITKEKIKELDEKFAKTEKMINSQPTSALKDQYVSIIEKRIEKILDEVDKEIMIILDQNNMIFPDIAVTGWQDMLKERYSLGQGGENE